MNNQVVYFHERDFWWDFLSGTWNIPSIFEWPYFNPIMIPKSFRMVGFRLPNCYKGCLAGSFVWIFLRKHVSYKECRYTLDLKHDTSSSGHQGKCLGSFPKKKKNTFQVRDVLEAFFSEWSIFPSPHFFPTEKVGAFQPPWQHLHPKMCWSQPSGAVAPSLAYLKHSNFFHHRALHGSPSQLENT